MTTPTITVIVSSVPQLNGESLRQCLTSVGHQTFASLECLLSVPQSQAEQTNRLLSEQGFDSRFKLCTAADSENEAILINTALKIAQGDFVLILGANDLLAPTCLDSAITCRNDYNADYVLIDVRAFQDARTIYAAPAGQVDILASPRAAVALLCRRELLGPFNERVAPFHLQSALVRLMAASHRAARLISPLYLWRLQKTDSSLLQGSLERFMDEHAEIYSANWKEIMASKDSQIHELTNELAANYEALKHENEMLQSKFDQLSEKHQNLEEHHARSLSSIKVTGIHLLRAIFSRFQVTRS
ncbi:MAG: hypothetical protein K2W95_23955 [Candidatus Obscuribacterales bacterium]|nr:hypothetical protein [Candidatus Obscuribacterales bacterium]